MKLKELTHAAVQRLDAAFLAGVAEATIDDELLELSLIHISEPTRPY